jgi:HSP20 family protein
MLMPSIFRDNLFDDFMSDPWKDSFFAAPSAGRHLMSTDVKENDQSYELDIELPGYKKEDVKAELKNGYLTISASRNANNDEKDEKGNYIRRERYSGSCSRSFYVGEGVSQEDIHAKFENGILKLEVPKADAKKVEEKRYIPIEG